MALIYRWLFVFGYLDATAVAVAIAMALISPWLFVFGYLDAAAVAVALALIYPCLIVFGNLEP
jgi:hypothetical protein